MTLAEVYTLMQSESPDLASISYYDHIEVDEGAEVFPPFIIFGRSEADRSMRTITSTT